MKIHIVQKGDTLWKIAQKYGVQFEELKQINSQLSNPDMIMPGMKIKVPSTGTAKNAQMMQSNAKINFGAKKEAPIPGVTVSPVKEMPKQEMVSPIPVQPQPKVIKEQPMPQPKVIQEQPMPQPAPVLPQMPQPIIPDVDINNYYMVNMSNMMAQKPQQVAPQPPQPQPLPQPAPQPIVVEKEKEESPVQVQPYPVMAEGCVPITPVMPGAGFCPPVYPMHHLMHGPGPVQIQPMPLYKHHESSSWCEPQMPSWQYGEFMPVMNQQQWAPFYGGMPYNLGVYAAPAPFASPHGMHHHVESSSSHYHTANMQPTYIQENQMIAEMPMVEEEEDCGCGGPKFTADTDVETNVAPQPIQYYQPQMQQWDQVQKVESHPQMAESQMNTGQQAAMPQPQVNYNQADVNQGHAPMAGYQAGMYQQPMGAATTGMYQQPMGESHPGVYQPQLGGAPIGHMYQPQMGGTQQPAMPQASNGGFQPNPYQMPMQPWQQGMLQPQMTPNQPGVFVPQVNYPPGNPVPFYGQDDYATEIGQMRNYSDAFNLPRFADESNE